MPESGIVLEMKHLSGGFERNKIVKETLRDVSFSVREGIMTAIVGETGSGKTLTALSILGVAPPTFRRKAGEALFDGIDLFRTDERVLRKIRGGRISMVFQDARAALNPVFSVGVQLRDVCRVHQGLNRHDAEAAVERMLDRVRIPEARRRIKQYPHEFSGGMAQRVMLAMALICQPQLLVLDEPTTGLDVTIQADIMELIIELTSAQGLSSLLITHDLGVVAESCEEVVVMRDGLVLESGSCEQIFNRPSDDYTKTLIRASQLVEPTR